MVNILYSESHINVGNLLVMSHSLPVMVGNNLVVRCGAGNVFSGAARALVAGVKLAMEGLPCRVGPLPKNEN